MGLYTLAFLLGFANDAPLGTRTAGVEGSTNASESADDNERQNFNSQAPSKKEQTF